MDSAMTKVYAAADTKGKLMIYDGRMGAGLCLLLRAFVMEQRRARKLLSPKMPPELDFLWGPGRGDKDDRRNPTIKGTFEVSRLGPATNSDRRAEVSWRANCLAELVTAPSKQTALQFERALFMIGYDIRRMPSSDFRRIK
jgi:hypothetical protein